MRTSWVLLAILFLPASAFALFDRPIALQGILDKIPLILLAHIKTVDAEKGTAVLTVKDTLKGETELVKFAVNLKDGLTEAGRKGDHAKVLADRLGTDRCVLLFIKPEGTDYSAYGFVDGTWFQLAGTTEAEKKTVRWALLNCEPALRGTYKGSTEELRALSVDVLARKAKAPEPNAKEKPGFGPTVDDDKRDRKDKKDKLSTAGTSGPVFGVIPTTVFLAPLAILAAIFPSTFAGLASGVERWRAFLVVVGINGTLAAIYFFVQKSLPNQWWCSPTAFTALLSGVVAIGFGWAGFRYRGAAELNPDISRPPTRREVLVIFGSALGTVLVMLLVTVLAQWFSTGSPFNLKASEFLSLSLELPARELTAAMCGLFVAACYGLYRRASSRTASHVLHLSAPGEAVALGAMLLFGTVVLMATLPRANLGNPLLVEATDEGGASAISVALLEAKLWFISPDVESVFSGLCITPDRVYFGGEKDSLFRRGAIVGVERSTGQQAWVFSDRELRTVFSTPSLLNGTLFCGEGLHTDPACRLLGLNAANGQKLWEHRTSSHTEGTPAVGDTRIYFSAGDDGIYVTDANGNVLFHHRGREQKRHIDTPLTLNSGRLYGGSGYQTLLAFCLDATTGNELWKQELPLRSFSQPVVMGRHVYFALGTGNLTDDLSVEVEPGRPLETAPAGMILCLTADTGRELWRCDLPRSSHTALAGDQHHLFAACRNGFVYAVNRHTGRIRWKVNYHQPLTTGVAVAAYTAAKFGVAVYVVTPSGLVVAHEPNTGAVLWSHDMAKEMGEQVEAMAAPSIVDGAETGLERQVFVPFTRVNRNNGERRACIMRYVDRLRDD